MRLPAPLPHLGAGALVMILAVGCQAEEPSTGSSGTENEPSSAPAPETVDAPGECVERSAATRTTVEGDAQWARFCPGADGHTATAEIPSDALTSHLDLLAELTDHAGTPDGDDHCRRSFGRTYRLQIGFAGGEVVQVSGTAAPSCAGTIHGQGLTTVRGPADLGVYGVVMAAFGQQYADRFDATPADEPLVCPDDPRKPASVDLDGASTALETGIRYGRPEPMVMPVAAVRGVLCTWPRGEDVPTVRDLSADEAERVRIGMHAIFEASVDCAGSPDPTYTAVVEDKTGTRRAVTVVESECSTVIASDDRFGLGFPWLDR